MIDKSLRMKVPKQGGVKNYLGKQKMVKAPKKWKSAPNHPDTELAYITKAEKDALIKMNLHGSMNGKAHKGPSGIISLNGWGDADRGYDSPSSSSSSSDSDHHGGTEDYEWEAYNPPAPAPATIDEPSWTGEGDSSYTGVTPVTYDDSDDDQKAESYVNWDPEILGKADSDDEYETPDRKHEKLTQNEINEAIKDLKKTDQYDTTLTKEQKKQVNTELAAYYGDKPGTKYDLSDFGADKAWGQKKSGLGTILKAGATALAWPLASAFVPPKVATALTWGKRFKDVKEGKGWIGKLGEKTGLTDRINKAAENLTKPRERDPYTILGEEGGDQRTYAEQLKENQKEKEGDGLAQAVSGQTDVVSKAVNQFRGTKVENQISSLVTNNLNKALQFYAQMTPRIEAGEASRQEMDAYELLGFYLNKQNQAMQGGNKYI